MSHCPSDDEADGGDEVELLIDVSDGLEVKSVSSLSHNEERELWLQDVEESLTDGEAG